MDFTIGLFGGSRILVYVGPDPETREQAWDITIMKWEMLVKYPVSDGATGTCGLCILYWCMDCPIGQDTRRVGCHSTPYWEYHNNPTRENAKAMLDYLMELRKNDEEPDCEFPPPEKREGS